MRKAIYFLSTGELLLLAGIWISVMLTPSDSAGQGMGQGFLTMAAIGVALCVIPALLFAQSKNWRGLGVFFATLPVILFGWLLSV
ncbi:MAG: hypothetical protein GJ676_09690 [Rhodobacteraceae bacterium]|nr:hypothetical protein [Paracoccaceae bacterium]